MAYESSVKIKESNEKKANRDPITGEPGSHPVATGIGSAIGLATGVASAAAMGAATGAALGPAGMIAGAAAGAIFGGGVGHEVGEDIYPTQLAWWKDNYVSRPYVAKGTPFEYYEPAYRYGIEAGINNKGHDFGDLEPSLRNNWNIARGQTSLEWNEAKHAARDAFERLGNDNENEF